MFRKIDQQRRQDLFHDGIGISPYLLVKSKQLSFEDLIRFSQGNISLAAVIYRYTLEFYDIKERIIDEVLFYNHPIFDINYYMVMQAIQPELSKTIADRYRGHDTGGLSENIKLYRTWHIQDNHTLYKYIFNKSAFYVINRHPTVQNTEILDILAKIYLDGLIDFNLITILPQTFKFKMDVYDFTIDKADKYKHSAFWNSYASDYY